jgi:hypothetical protein
MLQVITVKLDLEKITEFGSLIIRVVPPREDLPGGTILLHDPLSLPGFKIKDNSKTTPAIAITSVTVNEPMPQFGNPVPINPPVTPVPNPVPTPFNAIPNLSANAEGQEPVPPPYVKPSGDPVPNKKPSKGFFKKR